MNINERNIALRSAPTNYSTLKEYMDRRRVTPLPFNENAQVAVSSANFVLIDSTMTVATNLAIGLATTENAGLMATVLPGAVGTASTNSTSDTLGNILNLVSIRDSSTHDAITTSSGREVFALVQAVSTATDGDAIGAAASENVQLSFVYISSDGTLTAETLNQTIEFGQNNVYLERLLPDIMLEGGNPDADALAVDALSIGRGEYIVTTAFVTDEVITVATGAGATAGVTTMTGETLTLGVDAATFNADNLLSVLKNGVEILKGTDIIWDSATTCHFVEPLDIGDNFWIRRMS